MPTYPITSKENYRQIRVAIRRVYLDVWDPIRISDSPHAQDEYDSYLAPMLELLLARASDAELNEYLADVVSGMGMDGSRQSYADVIAALRAIPLSEDQTIAKIQ